MTTRAGAEVLFGNTEHVENVSGGPFLESGETKAETSWEKAAFFPDSVLLPKISPTVGDYASKITSSVDAIILVYPFDGCREGATELTHTSEEVLATTVPHSRVSSARQTREKALSTLEQRVNEEIYKNWFSEATGQRGLSAMNARNTDKNAPSEFMGWKEPMSVRLKTRYLETLQMEVTKVPDRVTAEDMIRVAQEIPCVQFATKDYVKTVPYYPATEGGEDAAFGTEAAVRRLQENDQIVLRKASVPRTTASETSERSSETGASDLTNKFPINISGRKRKVDGISFDNITENRLDHIPPRDPAAAETRFEDDVVRSSEFGFPDDPMFERQWHLQDINEWGIDAQEGWQIWTGSPDFVVAIIDSGCDLDHPELSAKLWVNEGEVCDDGIDNDDNGYVDDCYGWDWANNDNDPSPEGNGHGTSAAGIIAAATNNQLGISGICWECRIMCLKFIDAVEGRVSNQVSAIDYATKMGARISNNSYGGYGFSELEFEVIRRAGSRGHLFVSSAGNNNHDTDIPSNDHTPSSYKLGNILAVGANSETGQKARFSNFGQSSVDVFAPGSRITTIATGGGYKTVSGTSFAAPMITGIASLIWSRYPSLSHEDMVTIILDSCKKSPYLSDYCACGGVISLPKALENADSFFSGSYRVLPTADKSRQSMLRGGSQNTGLFSNNQGPLQRIIGPIVRAHSSQRPESTVVESKLEKYSVAEENSFVFTNLKGGTSSTLQVNASENNLTTNIEGLPFKNTSDHLSSRELDTEKTVEIIHLLEKKGLVRTVAHILLRWLPEIGRAHV